MWSGWCLCSTPSNRILRVSSASNTFSIFGLVFPTTAAGFSAAVHWSFSRLLLLASEFPTFHEQLSWYVWILRHVQWRRYYVIFLLALSSFGFSVVHLCFAFFFAASDICFHICGHTLAVLEVVCFLVSLSPDHVYPSRGLSVNKKNLVKPAHATDNSLTIHAPVIVIIFPSLHQVMYECSGNVDVLHGKGSDYSFGMYSLTLGSTWWR